MNVLATLLLVSQISAPPLACINTSYSRTDEIVITDDLGHLIIGAFAHHGPAFYQHEVDRCLQILATRPDDFDARNDLGAAYTKLGQWPEAQAAFDENERRHSGRYETASNQGVMYKKRGDYEKAAEWITRALKIKPGGHMGLGDYYLQMIQWRKTAELVENSGAEIETNFLGVRYDAGSAATADAANHEYVITLIKNDMEFADAYLVLGDVLFHNQEYQLALRAYYRASELSHPHDAWQQRLVDIVRVWRDFKEPGYVVERGYPGRSQVGNEIAAAKKWLREFQQLEASRIARGKDVHFSAMRDALDEAGITKPKILEAGYYRGYATRPSLWGLAAVAFSIVSAGLAAFLCVYRRLRTYLIVRQASRWNPAEWMPLREDED